MMVNGFYLNRVIWGGARLCADNNLRLSLWQQDRRGADI